MKNCKNILLILISALIILIPTILCVVFWGYGHHDASRISGGVAIALLLMGVVVGATLHNRHLTRQKSDRINNIYTYTNQAFELSEV